MTEDVSSRSLALLGVAAVAAGLLGVAVIQSDRATAITGGMDAHIHMMGADAREGAMARPTTTVKPLSCEKLPNVPGHSITTALVEFPPNAYTPRHRHPGPVTAFVIKGALRSQMEGGPAVTYTMGQTWFEAPGAIHAFAENASATEPAELLAIFVAEDDCGPLTIPVPD
ncbi:cupin domain-containing protein [Mesorhizobium sp. BH1-1-5]|uniref:cupin domain-containing protein n=1 Tax=Mesorhizobium sp. BH1-1-5 TaxID=2876661 RepID=UPI001CC9CD3E|nr:cupin domain-containing protein [Mesorhizobium sp. BH1-1-5]MBZ9988044.1 cupin domain-containing protein [Mesorhizobium sp. BH1-1-5]